MTRPTRFEHFQWLGDKRTLRVHNLDTLGLPFVLVVFTVVGIGLTTFVSATQAWRRRLGVEGAAPVTPRP